MTSILTQTANILSSVPTINPIFAIVCFIFIPLIPFTFVICNRLCLSTNNTKTPGSSFTSYFSTIIIDIFDYVVHRSISYALFNIILLLVLCLHQAAFCYKSNFSIGYEVDYYLRVNSVEFNSYSAISSAQTNSRLGTIPYSVTYESSAKLSDNNKLHSEIFAKNVHANMNNCNSTSTFSNILHLQANEVPNGYHRNLGSSSSTISIIYHTKNYENVLSSKNNYEFLLQICKTENNIRNMNCMQSGSTYFSILTQFFTDISLCTTSSLKSPDLLHKAFINPMNAYFLQENINSNSGTTDMNSAIVVSYFDSSTCSSLTYSTFQKELYGLTVGSIEATYVNTNFLSQEFLADIYNVFYLTGIAAIASAIVLLFGLRGLVCTIVTCFCILMSMTASLAVLPVVHYSSFSAFNVLSLYILIGVGTTTVLIWGTAWRTVFNNKHPIFSSCYNNTTTEGDNNNNNNNDNSNSTESNKEVLEISGTSVCAVYSKIGYPAFFTALATFLSLFSKLASPVIVISQLGLYMGVCYIIFYAAFHYIIIPCWIITSKINFCRKLTSDHAGHDVMDLSTPPGSPQLPQQMSDNRNRNNSLSSAHSSSNQSSPVPSNNLQRSCNSNIVNINSPYTTQSTSNHQSHSQPSAPSLQCSYDDLLNHSTDASITSDYESTAADSDDENPHTSIEITRRNKSRHKPTSIIQKSRHRDVNASSRRGRNNTARRNVHFSSTNTADNDRSHRNSRSDSLSLDTSHNSSNSYATRVDVNRVDPFNRHSINNSSGNETKEDCSENMTNIETNDNSYLASIENIPRAILVTSENEFPGEGVVHIDSSYVSTPKLSRSLNNSTQRADGMNVDNWYENEMLHHGTHPPADNTTSLSSPPFSSSSSSSFSSSSPQLPTASRRPSTRSSQSHHTSDSSSIINNNSHNNNHSNSNSSSSNGTPHDNTIRSSNIREKRGQDDIKMLAFLKHYPSYTVRMMGLFALLLALGINMLMYFIFIEPNIVYDFGIPQLFSTSSNLGQVLYLTKTYKHDVLTSGSPSLTGSTGGGGTVATTGSTYIPSGFPTPFISFSPTVRPTRSQTPTRLPTRAPTKIPSIVTSIPTVKSTTAAPTPSVSLQPTIDTTRGSVIGSGTAHTDYSILGCYGISQNMNFIDEAATGSWSSKSFLPYIANLNLLSDMKSVCSYIDSHQISLNVKPGWIKSIDCIYDQLLVANTTLTIGYYTTPSLVYDFASKFWGTTYGTNANFIKAYWIPLVLLFWCYGSQQNNMLGVDFAFPIDPTNNRQVQTGVLMPVWVCTNYSVSNPVDSLSSNIDVAFSMINLWNDAIFDQSYFAKTMNVNIIVTSQAYQFPILAQEVLLSIELALIVSVAGFIGLVFLFTRNISLSLLGTLCMFTVLVITIGLKISFFSSTVDLLDIACLVAIIGMLVDFPIHLLLHFFHSTDKLKSISSSVDDTVVPVDATTAVSTENISTVTNLSQNNYELAKSVFVSARYSSLSLLFPLVIIIASAVPLLSAVFSLISKIGEYILLLAISSYIFTIAIFSFMLLLSKYFYMDVLYTVMGCGNVRSESQESRQTTSRTAE